MLYIIPAWVSYNCDDYYVQIDGFSIIAQEIYGIENKSNTDAMFDVSVSHGFPYSSQSNGLKCLKFIDIGVIS